MCMQRRIFLKKTGFLAGGILASGKLLADSKPPVSIKVGIIGCGDRGKGIIHILKTMPDYFQIVALCDILEFRLSQAKKFQDGKRWKTYRDFSKMLETEKLDAVVVAVPLHLHYPIAVSVIKKGLHLYLEKTMTYDIDQALDLVELMKNRNNQVLQVGHQYRYSPLYYKVKELIDKGYLGKVTQVDCRWDRNGSWRRPVDDPELEKLINWRMYKAYSGGLIAELLSHQIDFINWLFNVHPDQFSATGGIDVFADGRETYDNVQVMLRYSKRGLIGNFGSMCGNAYDGYLFKIKGTLGTLSLLTDEGFFYPEEKAIKAKTIVDGVTGASAIIWNNKDGTPILPDKTKDGTVYAFKDFYMRIQDGRLPDSNVVTGARTAISVHLANEALYRGKIVHWPDNISI